MTSDVAGNYQIPRVPPGDYKIFAWEDIDDGAWMDPEVLRKDESRGKSIRVGTGRGEAVNVTVIGKK